MTNSCSIGAKPKEGEMFACAAPNAFPVETYRADFPILSRPINGRMLAYFDSGASAQKPRIVLEAMERFFTQDYANIHRGVHALSMRATDQYEAVRGTVRRFINAARDEEIVFTHGTTDGINLVAGSWGRANLKAGDEIVLTELEHHANIVPWQLLRDQIGIVLRVVPVSPSGEVDLNKVEAAMSPRTKLVAVAHVSNALGTILPVKEIGKIAHKQGALFLVDGAQSAAHMPVDVQALDTDFYVFSGHKLYGPTGVGILYGKYDILKKMPPYQGGGDMIASVSFAQTTYKDAPYRFEAGTPPIVEVIGMGAALDYLGTIGMSRIAAHEKFLLTYATAEMQKIEGVKIIGTAKEKAGILSFIMQGVHPHDIGTILDNEGVAIRAGHHCAQPLMDAFGIPATARASFALYNNVADIDALTAAVRKAQEMFA